MKRERKGRKDVREGKWRGGVDIACSTFSLVYTTPLLQHLAKFGLNPALSIGPGCRVIASLFRVTLGVIMVKVKLTVYIRG